MPQAPERCTSALRSLAILAAIALLMSIVPVTPSLAQAAGQVRVKIIKAGLLVGGGGGRGVLTYRGRNYPFRITGVSLGITAGATINRLDGWAYGIKEVSDFAGSYSSLGFGAALVGGVSGVQLRNARGVMMVLQGPKAGMEFAANLSEIVISLK
jgi:hypothetical protein